jgi:3-mercaptopyruvate sulfurtransferase SseA
MSADAVETLTALGYRDIIELRGGMIAWVADGRTLLPTLTRKPPLGRQLSISAQPRSTA